MLLGDALHTAHFSIGSGTKLAMEDAIALKDCFAGTPEVRRALGEFENRRKPVIENYQAAAQDSMVWFENARQYMHLDPLLLAYSLMTRSGRVGEEELRKRDPEFMAAWEAATKEAEADGRRQEAGGRRQGQEAEGQRAGGTRQGSDGRRHE